MVCCLVDYLAEKMVVSMAYLLAEMKVWKLVGLKASYWVVHLVSLLV